MANILTAEEAARAVAVDPADEKLLDVLPQVDAYVNGATGRDCKGRGQHHFCSLCLLRGVEAYRLLDMGQRLGRFIGQYRNNYFLPDKFDNMHNLLASILAKGIGQQLKQGLYREYLNKKEDMAVMRGKIDMLGTIKNKIARQQVLSCDYDELSENNLLNQILKTTVMILLRLSKVDSEHKDALKKEMMLFSNVNTIEPTSIRWTAIRFRRNNQTYRMLISICQLILEGMLLTTEQGEYKLASFIDEQRMCRLYEKFILEYYIKEFPALSVSASEIRWALDDGIGMMLPTMQSDITLSYGNEVFIIDAKYYSHTTQVQYDVHTLHSGNLYQIFTYPAFRK